LGASPLGPPPPILFDTALPKQYLHPSSLVRVSAYTEGEPYFGVSGNNRFDAPGCADGFPEYAICYLGTSLEVALAESILHDEVPVQGMFRLTAAHVLQRYALYFDGEPLHLLDLTGAQLKRLGGSAELTGLADYAMPRQWARAVHCNPSRFDGFSFMSRHYNTGRAVALFDRARGKLALSRYAQLVNAAGFSRAQKKLGIAFT
jgi:hypothetical protein